MENKYLISETTKEERKEIVKKALATDLAAAPNSNRLYTRFS